MERVCYNPTHWEPTNPNDLVPEVESFIGSAEQKLRNIQSRLLLNQPLTNNCPSNVRHFWKTFDLRHPTLDLVRCDKNLGIAIVDKAWSQQQRQHHFSTFFQELSVEDAISLAQETNSQVKGWTKTFYSLFTSDSVGDFINSFCRDITNVRDLRKVANRCYLMAKVHKAISPKPSRLITPSLQWLSTGLSKWIDATLLPIVHSLPFIYKDSAQFIRHLDSTPVPATAAIVAFDIVALYPNIPCNEDTWSLFHKHLPLVCNLSPASIHSIIEALKIITNFHLIFCEETGQWLHQKGGTAMGVAAAVSFANLYLYFLEAETNLHWCYKHHPSFHSYGRYIDDGYATVDQEFLPSLINSLMMMRYNSKFKIRFTITVATSEPLPLSIQQTLLGNEEIVIEFISGAAPPFLDIQPFFGPRWRNSRLLDTRMFSKRISNHLYLPANSMHTYSCKRGFIKGEVIRILKASSSRSIFHDTLHLLYQRLRDRNYDHDLLVKTFLSIPFDTRNNYLLRPNKSTNNPKKTPLIFNLKYNYTTASLNTKKLFGHAWTLMVTRYPALASINFPITAWSKTNNLFSYYKTFKRRLDAEIHSNSRI